MSSSKKSSKTPRCIQDTSHAKNNLDAPVQLQPTLSESASKWHSDIPGGYAKAFGFAIGDALAMEGFIDTPNPELAPHIAFYRNNILNLEQHDAETAGQMNVLKPK